MKSTDQTPRQQSPYLRRQLWPYHQTQKGGTPKPRGFWQDSRTQAILECYKSTVITESQASEILRVDEGDIKYYANKKNKE
jgi:hypothetical protein